MSSKIVWTILLLCCIASAPLFATELRIAFSRYTPPYVLDDDDAGIVVDIVRTALESNGHTVAPVYVSIGRAFKLFAARRVDGTTITQTSSGQAAEYSIDFMRYHNRAFTLKTRALVIREVADLRGKSVAAFQNAHKYLGTDFAQAVADNARYKEMARQEAQIHMLLLGRIDVAVTDESIFRYYQRKLIDAGRVAATTEVVAHDIFPPTPYKAAFHDPAVRDQFDRAIIAMRQDGRYDAIYRKYAERYFPIKQ